MKNYELNNNTVYRKNTTKQGEAAKKVALVKISIDTHARSYTSSEQVEGSKGRAPRRWTPEAFLPYVAKQLDQAEQVVTCYEAGPIGFHLHRKLEAMGVKNYVICPTKLDSRNRGVNTDNTDCIELGVRLDRYVAGNDKAFTVVAVPSLDQERVRRLGRQREQFLKDRKCEASRGRTMLLTEGIVTSNRWWEPKIWEAFQKTLQPVLVKELERYRRIILALNQEMAELEAEMVQQTPAGPYPVGMGPVTRAVVEAEVWDWKRIKSWRSAGAFAGLTGGVSGSGERTADLSITKTGNRRVAHLMVEMAWRMTRCQPDYWVVKKYKHILGDGKKGGPKPHVRGRKRTIVAFARRLFVDLWRWKTGKVTPEQLGWKMTDANAKEAAE